MPRFAILDHDHPFPHWDFLLEAGTALRAWRLLEEPARGRVIAAESLPDHRLLYLDYDGPVSGGRGRVVRWDVGEFVWDKEDANDVRVRLSGGRVAGPVRVRLCEDGRWLWEWG
jgi:hypothetical protein